MAVTGELMQRVWLLVPGADVSVLEHDAAVVKMQTGEVFICPSGLVTVINWQPLEADVVLRSNTMCVGSV